MQTYITYSASDIGCVRKENQDTIGVLYNMHPSCSALLAVVCDGVGGLTAGKYASDTTYRKFVEWFQYEFVQIAQEEHFEKILQTRWMKLVENHNRFLYETAKANEIQLGTTLTALLLYEGKYYTIQVGDTRAYKVSDELIQLTEDQTLIAYKVRTGQLSKEEAKTAPGQNVILQSVGYKKHIEPIFSSGVIYEQDDFLICSDGFYHYVTDREIYDCHYGENSVVELKQKLDEMIETVKQRGETDNISVAYLKAKI